MNRIHLALLGCLLLLLTGCAGGPAAPRTPDMGHTAGRGRFQRVVIDAGHGGKDSGATSSSAGVREKDLALDTALRVRQALAPRFKVNMIRTTDTFVDLDERVVMANRLGDVLVSIHYNSSGAAMHGPEVYYWRVDSHGLAVRLQRSLNALYGGNTNSRGLVRRRLRLTRNPNIPCVLVECGYLSNRTEAGRVANASFRQQIANAIAGAIIQQSAIGDSGTGPLPPPLNEPLSRGTDRRQ